MPQAHTGLFQNPMNIQRLEDFTNYISCIKCYGKPIIPPLVTVERKEEICVLRASAVRKENEISRRENSSRPARKAKETCLWVADHPVDSSIPRDFILDDGDAQHNASALHFCSVNELQSSPSTDVRSFESLTHVSITKIPSSDICSTVHTGVIVCSNVCNNKHVNAISLGARPFSSPFPPNELCFHMTNPGCSLCQTKHPHGPFTLAGVPYINSPAERICSVSDEDQGSVAEETEFESLVTVISGEKIDTQDIDNESNFTCLTQSTDLEKYLDCSIEYSSPDDGASLTKSQMSSHLNISSRSDDASSETLVNTESELTPCASALPDLNGYPNEDTSRDSSIKKEVPSSIALASSDVHQRAYSVDSYMKIVKSCAENLFMKKSQSEPSHSDLSSISNNFLPPVSSCIGGISQPAILNSDMCADTFQMSEDSVYHQVSDDDLSCDNVGYPAIKGKKASKRGHVRSNSYTLDEPSSVLIMAHADCNCKDDSETVISPHSCSSEKVSIPPPNPAFKKEKINIILPPTPDRDKYFPISMSSSLTCRGDDNREMNLKTPIPNAAESDKLNEDNRLSNTGFNQEDNIIPEEETTKSNATESESERNEILSHSNADDEINLEQVEILVEGEKNDAVSATGEELQPNKQNIVTSFINQSILKGDVSKASLNEIFLKVKQQRQAEVQKLIEEENRNWVQLNEKFKKEDLLLCSELSSMGIFLADDDALGNKSPSVNGDKNKQNVFEPTPSDFQFGSDVKSLHNLNIGNKDDKESIPTRTENSKKSEISKLKASENKINNEDKVFVGKNLLSTSAQHFSIPENSAINADKNVSNTSKPSPSAVNTDPNVIFHEDSLERFHNVHTTLTPSSVSNLDYHKFQSSDDAVGRFSSVPSENFTIPCSHNPFKGKNSSSESIHAVNYQPMIRTSGCSINKNAQNPAYQKHGSVKPESNFHVDCPSKDRVCDASSEWPGGAYFSEATPCTFTLPAHVSSHSDLKISIDKSDQANFCTSPHYQSDHFSGEIIPSAYPPCLQCDDMALREKSICSKNLPAFQHFSDGEHLEGSVLRSLGNCSSMSLPIMSDSAEIKQLGQKLTYNRTGALKGAATNFQNDPFEDSVHFNNAEKLEIRANPLIQQQWYPDQNEVFGGASLKNKIPDPHQDSEIKLESTVLDSSMHNLSNMSRKVCSKQPLNITTKSQSDSSICLNVHKMPLNVVPTTQAKVQKQIFSSSLTNLKRKQSKDFIRDPNILNKFEKLPAFVKGYLTRRLFKTERVQGLKKTLHDTGILVGKLSEELTVKGGAVLEHDVDFYRQLTTQMLTTYYNLYDIFCTISVKERMQIISESRSLQQKKKTAEKSKDSLSPVVVEKAASPSRRRSKLSAATLKALERKKRLSIDNRTYTVEDLKGCRVRNHSSSSSKSHPNSPSRIYKSSVGIALKRKTTSAQKTQYWK